MTDEHKTHHANYEPHPKKTHHESKYASYQQNKYPAHVNVQREVILPFELEQKIIIEQSPGILEEF